MKNFSFYILTVFLLTSCSSLKNNTASKNEELDSVLFNRGVAIYQVIDETSFDYELENIDTTSLKGKVKYETLLNKKEDIYDFALEQFEKVIEEYPNSKLYHKSLYNLAHINALMDYEEGEIKYLKMMLSSNANDKESSGRSGIMSNPYANFKNEASNRLTELYIKKGDYTTALTYKKLNEKYPLQHFCGNAFAADELYSAKQYAKIYLGMGEKEKALDYLLPHIFDNGLASNSSLVDLTVEILKKNFDQSFTKADFEKSISDIHSKTEKRRGEEWTNYYINYFDTEIEVPSWTLSFDADNEKTKAELEKVIRASEFYKKLNYDH